MEIAVKNEKLKNWVKEIEQMCTPDTVYWCDGSKKEYNALMSQMEKSGMAIKLKKRKNSFLFRSDPSDVAQSGKSNLYQHSFAERGGSHK